MNLRNTHYALRNRKGFTLVEVLIVVGIIGLLASVVLSGLGSVRSRGRDARRVADLRQVQQGLELYYTRCQSYPGDNGCGGSSIQGGGGSWEALKDALVDSTLGITNISSDPSCNSSCSNYTNYQFGTDGQSYVLKATLEDKDSPLQKDSFTGDEFGVNCAGDRDYCVKF